MKTLVLVAAALMLAACGVETASTASTAAALKKQEIEQGRKNMEQFHRAAVRQLAYFSPPACSARCCAA